MNAASLESATLADTPPPRDAADVSADNVFLTDDYAPVREERTDLDLRVTGTIPSEFEGLYVRNGPNPIAVEHPERHHWFVGDGMVHGLRFDGGRASWYRNRWVVSDRVAGALGRPRAPGPRHGRGDAVNTNVIGHAGRLWALVEAGALPVELDGDLTTRRHGLFDGDLVHAFSAHPHRDPATGALHAICYDGSNPTAISYVHVGASGAIERTLEIPVADGPMIHDCAVTAAHVVVFDLPVTFSMAAAREGSTLPYRWNPRHRARVGLLPHDGEASAIRWFDVDPCYVFHTANAFESPDGTVTVDCVVHDTMFDHSPHGPDSAKVTFERWTLRPGSSTVHRTVLDDTSQEFPRYDERRSTTPYRYAYTVGADFAARRSAPMLRHDLETGRVATHDFGRDRIPDEVVFVPREPNGAEDDGWLVSFVYDLREGRSDLVILNAADLGGDPQAVVHLPVPVPHGFHGNWITS